MTTTDSAAHLKFVINKESGISLSYIDEKMELKEYQEEVLNKARETMSEEDIAYIKEDLRSPCTHEIVYLERLIRLLKRLKTRS